jgi:hypothetical protein
MQKTNSISVFNEISLNFKGEIRYTKIDKDVKMGRGGWGYAVQIRFIFKINLVISVTSSLFCLVLLLLSFWW